MEVESSIDTLWEAAKQAGLGIQEKLYARGEHLLNQGDDLPGVFLLLSGLTRIYTTADNGQDILMGFAGTGELIGEVEYFSEAPVWCSVQAAQRTTAAFLPLASVRLLVDRDPRLGLALARTMAKRYHRDFQRTSSRITHRMAYSVLSICLSLAGGTGPSRRLQKRDVADYLATSVRHLNRVLKDLEAQGALETGPGEIRTVHVAVAKRIMDDSA